MQNRALGRESAPITHFLMVFWLLMVWVPNGFWVPNDCHPPVTVYLTTVYPQPLVVLASAAFMLATFYFCKLLMQAPNAKTSSLRERRLVNELVASVAVHRSPPSQLKWRSRRQPSVSQVTQLRERLFKLWKCRPRPTLLRRTLQRFTIRPLAPVRVTRCSQR